MRKTLWSIVLALLPIVAAAQDAYVIGV